MENLFKYLTDKEFAYLEKLLELKEYQDGETVIEEGTGGDQMYYITEGKVKIITEKVGEQLLLAELEEGSFFGEINLFCNAQRTATVIANGKLQVYVISREWFLNLINKKPNIAANIERAILEVIAQRIAKTNETMETYYILSRALSGDNEE